MDGALPCNAAVRSACPRWVHGPLGEGVSGADNDKVILCVAILAPFHIILDPTACC